MRKNQYEENLFRCEDDHYELDMVIETNASAIRAMKPLAEQVRPAAGPPAMDASVACSTPRACAPHLLGLVPLSAQALELESEEKVNWRLPPGKLSPIHFRAIQRIYGAARAAHITSPSAQECEFGCF